MIRKEGPSLFALFHYNICILFYFTFLVKESKLFTHHHTGQLGLMDKFALALPGLRSNFPGRAIHCFFLHRCPLYSTRCLYYFYCMCSTIQAKFGCLATGNLQDGGVGRTRDTQVVSVALVDNANGETKKHKAALRMGE